jgi:hypothetical protein
MQLSAVFAQTEDVKQQLMKYNIMPADFIVNLQPPAKDYAFNYTITQDTDSSVITMECSFDPTLVQPWKMHTYCNQPAGQSKKRILEKRVAKMAKEPVLIDEKSLSIKKLSYYLIVDFAADSTTLPPLYRYIKDCKGTAYINAATKRLEKITWENFRGTQYEKIRVSSLHQDVFVEIIDGKYRTVKEWREIRGRRKSQLKTYTETTELSNYEKQ